MAKKKEAEKTYRKISDKEYELQVNGRTKSILAPFGKVEKLFSAFIAGNGVIDERGNVQTDIITLVSSFHSIGDIMLTEYCPETGKVLVEGNCATLDHSEVIALFQVASEIISNFILSLSQISPQTQTSENEGENE